MRLLSILLWAAVAWELLACNALVGIPGNVTEDTEAGRTDSPSARLDAAADHANHDAHARSDVAPRDAMASGSAVFVSTGLGLQQWCAVTAGGEVFCWGNNEAGQLGNGTYLSTATPVKVKLSELASQVSVGNADACALTRSGGVWCWGYGSDGELGNGTTANVSTTPVPVTGLSSGVVALSLGDLDSCAVKADGSVWCWGDGVGGELGNGSMSNAVVPTAVTGLNSGVTAVSVGVNSACAVQRGAVVCWGGYDGSGELGNGSEDGSATPVPVTGLASGVKSVSVGATFACAVTTAGAVKCWGGGTFGQLGNDEFADSPSPVDVSGLSSGVVAVSAGFQTACALKSDGGVVCWGYGVDGQLGNGSAVFGATQYGVGVPVDVKGLSGPATAIATGNAPCAITTSGSIECWGFTSLIALTPVSVTNASSAALVTIGGYLDSESFACAISDEGHVECWGGNDHGQLGNGNRVASRIPVQNYSLTGDANAVATGAAANFACGITSGLVLCWGDNSDGQLGNGSTQSSSAPVAVEGVTGAIAVAVGGSNACAISSGDGASSGGVSCWGDNTYGALGNNSTARSTAPVPVTGLSSGVTGVSVGIYFACAVLVDGTVECWGNNTSGQLGNGTETVSLVPVQVHGVTSAVSVATGWYSACAVTTQGTIQCWGANTFGQLGDNSTVSTATPVTVSGITSGATQVAVGQTSACAVVNEGAQCWGGIALGYGHSEAELEPGLVTGLSHGVTAVAVGAASACAVVSGGVQCWGYNTAGQLGNGALANSLVAVPVIGFP